MTTPQLQHVSTEIQRFWDADAATYDRSAGHNPTVPFVRAAWMRTLERLLPPAPCRVLDVGAGTGFLSLMAAVLGYQVTALDVAPRMLARLQAKADAAGLGVVTVEGAAENPPGGDFDVVIERHVVWTLLDPPATLARWRAAAPDGRLVLVESVWGRAAHPVERARSRARARIRRLRGVPPDHHDHYPAEAIDSLPYGSGIRPDELVEVVAAGDWPAARIERLRDVEWAVNRVQPLPDRLLGPTAPYYALVAGR